MKNRCGAQGDLEKGSNSSNHSRRQGGGGMVV